MLISLRALNKPDSDSIIDINTPPAAKRVAVKTPINIAKVPIPAIDKGLASIANPAPTIWKAPPSANKARADAIIWPGSPCSNESKNIEIPAAAIPIPAPIIKAAAPNASIPGILALSDGINAVSAGTRNQTAIPSATNAATNNDGEDIKNAAATKPRTIAKTPNLVFTA